MPAALSLPSCNRMFGPCDPLFLRHVGGRHLAAFRASNGAPFGALLPEPFENIGW